MEDTEGIPHDDPRFVEILEACLHMEIAGHKESQKKNQAEIRRIKRNVLMKLEKRKELKNKIEGAEDLISTLNVTLKKLQENVRETETQIALMEAGADDRSKLRSYEMQRYHDILEEYDKTWQSYHARYEEFPLAKKRKQAQINVRRARIEEMVLQYQIQDMERKIRQKEEIDYLRTRSKIVEFVKAMDNSTKLEREFMDVTKEIDSCKQELHLMESQLKSLRVQEEEEKKARSMQLLEMPPPKINLSRVRLNYSRKCQEFQFKNPTLEIDNDSISVNTVTLEEMCINDESSDKTSKKQTAIEEHLNSSKQIECERATSFVSQINEKETRTIKNTETFIETTPLQKGIHGERELPFTDNTEAITKERSFIEKDIQKATPRTELREKKKFVADDKSNKCLYNVSELKKMKTFTQNEEKNIDNMESELPYYSLKFAGEKDTVVPRVLKIEKVQYDIMPLSRQKNIFETSKSIVSHNFETSESIAHSLTLKDSLMIKELNASRSVQPSMYDGSSLNFKYSECANVSTIADMDINMESIDAECQKVDRKEDDKDILPKMTHHFNFTNLIKGPGTSNFNLF